MAKRIRTAAEVAKWREAMRPHWERRDIDRSRCGPRKKEPEEIWDYIDKRGPDECWPYLRAKSHGYGLWHYQGKMFKAHRIVYALTHESRDFAGPLDRYSKNHVLHRCDNPGCCNPAHLYLGDIWDNMRDKVERNRCWRGGKRKREVCIAHQISGSLGIATSPK